MGELGEESGRLKNQKLAGKGELGIQGHSHIPHRSVGPLALAAWSHTAATTAAATTVVQEETLHDPDSSDFLPLQT